MTKDQVRAQLSAYLDGELGEAERRAVEAALAADPALRAYLDQLRRAAELIRSLPRASAPAGFAQGVKDAIASSQRVAEPRASLRWLSGWRPAALAAAACLLIGITILLTQRPERTREAARDISSVREHRKVEATPKAPAPDDAAHRELSEELAEERAGARDDAGPSDKLEAHGKVITTPQPEGEALARRGTSGYGDGRKAPGPAPERPALADGKDTSVGGRGAPPPKPAPAPERKATAFLKSERSVAPADVRKEPSFEAPTEPKPSAPSVAAKIEPAPAKSAPAPSREVVKEEAAKDEGEKQDSAAYATVPGGDLLKAKAGKAGADAFGSLDLDSEKRRAVDRGELLDAIEKEFHRADRAHRKVVGAFPGAGMANGVAARQAGAEGLRLAYTDLVRCLAEVQAALDGAKLAYSVRPEGGGEFVVETTLPEPEARALLARLAGPAKGKAEEGQQKIQHAQVGRPSPAMGAVRDLEKTVAGQLTRAKGAALPMVHLVLRFYRMEADAAAPAAERAPQK